SSPNFTGPDRSARCSFVPVPRSLCPSNELKSLGLLDAVAGGKLSTRTKGRNRARLRRAKNVAYLPTLSAIVRRKTPVARRSPLANNRKLVGSGVRVRLRSVNVMLESTLLPILPIVKLFPKTSPVSTKSNCSILFRGFDVLAGRRPRPFKRFTLTKVV